MYVSVKLYYLVSICDARAKRAVVVLRRVDSSLVPSGAFSSLGLIEPRHFEPLIADTPPGPRAATPAAAAAEEQGNREGGHAEGGGEGAGVDKLAIWWQYIQAVQDKLPSDQQV